MLSSRAITALLIANRHVAKKDLPALRNPDIRADVEGRLENVGMQLIADFYSPNYSIRPLMAIRQELEEHQLGESLDSDEHAALVLAWCKLVWPEIQEMPGPHQFTEAAFSHEFRDIFGSQRAKAVLSRLKNLDFLDVGDDGFYVAGPALYGNIDHSQMQHFVEQRASLVQARDRALRMTDDRSHPESTLEKIVIEFLRGAGHAVHLRDIYTPLERDSKEVRAALDRLQKANKVRLLDPDKKKYARWEVVA